MGWVIALLVLIWGIHPTRAADTRTEIEVAVFAGGEGMDFYTRCKEEYEKLHPEIWVNMYGDPRIDDKLRVRIIDGNTPDITNATELKHHELIREKVLQPFDPWLDKPSWDDPNISWRNSFSRGVLDKWKRDGHFYGIPMSFYVNAIWFNKDIFEKHGWTSPTTWEEFLSLCEKVKQAGIAEGKPGEPAYYPMAFQGMYPSYIKPLIDSVYFHTVGRAEYVKQQNAEAGSFDNPAFVKALTYVQTLALNYFKKGTMGESHTQAQTDFFESRTAMIPCGAWLKSEMMGKIPAGFRLGCFNLPIIAGTKEPDAVNIFGGYFFMFTNARHPNQAADFVRFVTSRHMAGMFSRMRDIPTPVLGSMKGNLSADMNDLVEIMNKSTGVYGESFNDTVAGMLQYWNNTQLDVCTGARTPQQIAKDMEEGAAQVRMQLEHPDKITIRHTWAPGILLTLIGGGGIYWALATIKGWQKSRGKPVTSAGRDKIAWTPLLLFLLPAVIVYSIFVILPSLMSFTWSVHRWNGISAMTWVGLLHFKRLLFEDDQFWTALNNNLFIMFVIPAFVLPISLFLAVCINRGLWGSKVFRIIFFFPNIIGGVAATLMWLHLYNPAGGPVNGILGLAFPGMKDYAWLSQQHLYWALVPMGVWGACGFNMILFLAAMQEIPAEMYEAAELDGASPWRQFWHVTLPLIWSAVSVSVVFMVIGGMKAFDVIWLLTNQQPVSTVHVVGTMMVQRMFQEFKVGEATAIAVILFLIVFVGTAATLKLMNRKAMDVG